MRGFFVFILQITFLALVALWLADQPGTAEIVWHDYVIQTSAAVLALCVLVLAYAFYLLFRVWHFLRHGPANWKLRRKLNKAEKGQDQLTQGLIAIASGNATEAGRLAVAARKNIGGSVAAQWLQAQAALLAGDRKAAREIFRALAADTDAAVLGYRGLITEAKRDGQWDEVDRLMNELHTKQPATPWLSLIRMESAARHRHWQDAESALSHAIAVRLLDSNSGRRTRSALRIAAGGAALARGDNDSALQAAEKAAKQSPDWLPAIINLAETLAKTGHNRAANRAIERAWKKHPHPQLAQIIRQQAANPLDVFKQTAHLCRGNESTPESRIALAEAALNANLWGEARRHLMASLQEGMATQSVYKMLAQLERRENGDERAAAAWMMKSSEAAPNPTWLCRACGGAHNEWQPLCSHCGSFNHIEWQIAGKSRGVLAYLQEGKDYD